MKCPTCGAVNDAANRFCDQCGTRLDSAPAPQAAVASQPAGAGLICPRCGSAVLPGEAFCDECGAPLSGQAPASGSNDAPTVLAPPAYGAGSAGQSLICPQCGRENLLGDRFCDNCGADLSAATTNGAGQPAAPATASEGVTMVPDQETNGAPAPEASPAVDSAATDASAPPVDASAMDTSAPPAEAEATTVTEAPADASEIPTVVPEEAPAASPAPSDAQAAYEAQRAQLNDEIARQQQVLTQLEPVQQALGPATPAGVLQSLDDARAAIAQLQAELDALTGAAPAAAAMAAPTETPAPAAEATAAPAPEAAPAPADEVPAETPAAPPEEVPVVAGPTDQTIVAPPTIQIQPAPAPAGARLLFEESGQEVTLPADKAEIIIGREDPISGIHPEVDMTPHGGESGGVSRQHARLNHADGQWTITDLNSTNYTRVDGVKLDPNVPTPLADGARIQLGRVAMTFRM